MTTASALNRATSAARHGAIERPGCVVHYWVAGGPLEAPTVVVSHAALTDHTFFETLVARLAGRLRVLTWDIRGHGRSRPLMGPLSVADAADDLLAILDSLRVERAVLVGHSLGSYVAQELAFRRPERVGALVVVDGACTTAGPLRTAVTPTMKVAPFEGLKRDWVTASGIERSSREYMRRQLDGLTKHEFLKILEGAAACARLEVGYSTPVPTLLVAGELDVVDGIRESMAAWAVREPSCESRVIPGAGHFANLDRPDEVDGLILDFVARRLDGEEERRHGRD